MRVEINEKKYRKNEYPTLENIELDFPENKATLIIGASGVGKSTLIKCITRQTNFNGLISGCEKSEIAYIPQHPALNERETAYASVYWSARLTYLSKSNKEIRLLTEDYIDRVGLDSVKDSIISDLSGGQKQRVAIARELIRNKPVIIADEIDTGLDAGTSRALIKRLVRETHNMGKTTIIISHNVMNVSEYDQVIVLAKELKKNKAKDKYEGIGRIAFCGPPRELCSYFKVEDLSDILKKLNYEDEDGDGKAMEFINEHSRRTSKGGTNRDY